MDGMAPPQIHTETLGPKVMLRVGPRGRASWGSSTLVGGDVSAVPAARSRS